jgi:hypothetical protein
MMLAVQVSYCYNNWSEVHFLILTFIVKQNIAENLSRYFLPFLLSEKNWYMIHPKKKILFRCCSRVPVFVFKGFPAIFMCHYQEYGEHYNRKAYINTAYNTFSILNLGIMAKSRNFIIC